MKIFVALFLLFGLFGCSSKDTTKSTPVRHMIKSDKLHILMRELDMVIYERQKSEIDRDAMRKRYLLTLADTLKNLSGELDKLIDEKNKEDQKVYQKHALLLKANANDLEELAHSYRFELLSQRLDEVKQSCNSCHKHFGVKR
jgi:cytochrome c556